MAKGEALRDRTATLILDSAATLLARNGESASMEEIAQAAGVGRATLYRHFANRDELLRAMAAASVEELAALIAEAGLATAPFEEALTRLTRAIVTTGTKYLAVSLDGGRHTNDHPAAEAALIKPVRTLVRRGVSEGVLRRELKPDLLMSLYSGLVRGVLEAPAQTIEETVAVVVGMFLRGAGTRR